MSFSSQSAPLLRRNAVRMGLLLYAAHIRAVMPASSSVLMSTSECWSEGGGRGEEEEEEEEEEERMD